MSDKMKIIDEIEIQKTPPPKKKPTNKQKKQHRKSQRSGARYSESVRAKWFCCAFKLGFVELICKTSLILKSNLELALSIILK